MNVPSETLIITNKRFGKKTITGYKKTDVKKKFIECLENNNAELATRWGIELHCSGNFVHIFKELIEYSGNFIESPMIFFILDKYINKYEIIKDLFKKQIDTRNNQETRNMLVDIIYIICTTNKNMIPKIKIRDTNEYMILSTNLNNINTIKQPNDRKESILAINEIMTILYKKKYKIENVYFWYYWLEIIEKKYKLQQLSFNNQQRLLSKGIEPDNFRWFLWEMILNNATRENEQTNYIINCMYNCYTFKHTKNTLAKRHNIILRALNLLYTSHMKPVIKNFSKRLQSCCNSNIFYKEIRDYLDENNLTSKIISKPKSKNYIDIQERLEKCKKKIEKKKNEELNMDYLFNYDAVRKK